MKQIKYKKGFTLLELSVIIIIIGIFMVFAIPKYKDAVERPKVQEAFYYLLSVKAAQEKYFAREGVYAEELVDLDISKEPLKYFSIGDMIVDENNWMLTIMRTGSKWDYTLVFDEGGFNEDESTITEDAFSSINQEMRDFVE